MSCIEPPPRPGTTRARGVCTLVVSRQALIDSRHSTVICVPVYSSYNGLEAEVLIGPEAGLKQTSSLHCDSLASIPRALLRDFVGSLTPARMRDVDSALRVALAITY